MVSHEYGRHPWWALDGFHLGRASQDPVEALVAREGPLLGLAVPGSWDLRGRGNEDDGMLWAARPVRDVQRGAVLKVHAQRLDAAAAPELRRQAIWRGLQEAGARLGAVLTVERAEFSGLVPGWGGQWQAAMQHGGHGHVAVLVQRDDEGVALDYVLTAPAAGTEHLDWMRATRALDIAIATSDPRPPRFELDTVQVPR